MVQQTYVFCYVMVEHAFQRVQVRVFLSLWHGSGEVGNEIVRGHFLKVDVATRNHSDLGHTFVRSVLVCSMLDIPTEHVLWEVT